MNYPTELTVFTRFMSQNIYTQITTRAKTAATCVLKPSVKSPNKGGRTPPPTRPTISKADTSLARLGMCFMEREKIMENKLA